MSGVKGQPTPGNPNPNIKDWGFGGKYSNPEREKKIWAKKRNVSWTKEKCISELNDLLDILKKILKDDSKLDINSPRKLKQETVRDAITMMNKILDVMKYLYPPIQQSVNVNVDVMYDKMKERWEEWQKKEEVVVIGEKDKDVEDG